MEKYLVTSALPYANGKLHIGHVAGAYLPADIFVRFQKLIENDVIYICGTDEHGAPISIKADAEGTEPQKIVDFYHESIKKSFEGLNFCFDNFSGTARPQHHKLAQEFFSTLLTKGFIDTEVITQFYCEHDKRFLADRYVEGICPFCNEEGARGDQCDHCGKLIDALELKEPKCKLCGNTPVIKETKHWFLDLPKFEPHLREWLETKTYWKDNVHKFIMGWLNDGLRKRAITRDINWGVPLPVEDAEGKVLYVWFDAPIGYISSTIEWAEAQGNSDKWKDYWFDQNTKLIHFIGKDNIPFHTIIWPAMVMEQEKKYILPHDVPANEYLNLEGKQLSTSRNWAIWVDEFLEYFDGELLRYVLAANAPETKDCDFYWTDFQNRVNTDLANVLGNLINRVLVFAKKYFDSDIIKPENLDSYKELFEKIDTMTSEVKDCFANYRVRKAVNTIMDIARLGNKFFDEQQPWKKVKESKDETNDILYICAEILRTVSIVFSPVLPVKMKALRDMLGLSNDFIWNDLSNTPDGYTFSVQQPLFPKITDEEIQKQIEILEEKSKAAEPAPEIEIKPEIEFDDFMKLDIKLVKILSAEKVKKSKKLLKLQIQCGNVQRTVMSGISNHYSPDDLVGKTVTMLLNLKPRKMMGVESQGMILAAENDGVLSLLVPDKDLKDGSDVS